MTLSEVRGRPTTIKFGERCHGYHESVLRAFHVLDVVRRMLTEGCPPAVLIEVIDDLMGAPHLSLTIHPNGRDADPTREKS